MKFEKQVKEIYKHFRSKEREGVKHIATPVTINALLCIAQKLRPTNILEIGGGGGTLTYSLLKYTNAKIDVYEDLDFCRSYIERNCTSFNGRFNILKTYEHKPPRISYDIVIIDGPSSKTKRDRDRVIKDILSRIKCRVVYIEGNRYSQRIEALRVLKSKYEVRGIRYGSVTLDGDIYKGGLEIICMPSKKRIKRFFLYIVFLTREQYHRIILRLKKSYSKNVGRFISVIKKKTVS